MSTLHEVTTFKFHNRKPSKVQIMACLNNAIKQGSKAIDIHWGENALEFSYNDRNYRWYGYGWIKDLGGDDIAQELNKGIK